jgi:hypothetical protein
MFVFRFEHSREKCANDKYNHESGAHTGHGPFVYCESRIERPNFGGRGEAPASITTNDRCGVTVEQFVNWIDNNYMCKNDGKCDRAFNNGDCDDCPVDRSLFIPSDWDLASYWLDDEKEGITWHEDNGQIVFNIESAQFPGIVDRNDIGWMFNVEMHGENIDEEDYILVSL